MSEEVLNIQDLAYQWNYRGLLPEIENRMNQGLVEIDSEDLRDAQQDPTVKVMSLEDKLRCVDYLAELGVQRADIGLPGNPAVRDDVLKIAQYISEKKYPIAAGCAARTLEADIKPIAEISQKAGIPIQASTFLGSSHLRSEFERWDLAKLVSLTESAIKFARQEGLPVMYVTEDTTRTDPQVLETLYRVALDNGAERICIADTVGYATVHGAGQIVKFTRELLKRFGYPDAKIDYHAHMDRGLALACSIEAIMAGADCAHGCMISIGERTGNTDLGHLLVNLRLLGMGFKNLSTLQEYCEHISQAADVPIPESYPIFGKRAYSTATGVHASAVLKARERKTKIEIQIGDGFETFRAEEIIYGSVPPSLIGRSVEVGLGPQGGKANIFAVLIDRGIDPARNSDLVEFMVAEQDKLTVPLFGPEVDPLIDSFSGDIVN